MDNAIVRHIGTVDFLLVSGQVDPRIRLCSARPRNGADRFCFSARTWQTGEAKTAFSGLCSGHVTDCAVERQPEASLFPRTSGDTRTLQARMLRIKNRVSN